MEDTSLAGIVPPLWRVGQTWTLEQSAWINRNLNPYTREPWRTVVDFEVVADAPDEAIIHVQAHGVWGTEEEATLTVAKHPFRLLAHTAYSSSVFAPPRVVTERERDGAHWRMFQYGDQLLVGFPPAPDVHSRNAFHEDAAWSSVDGGAAYQLLVANPEFAQAIVTWRAGDPWWCRYEVIDTRTGRTHQRRADRVVDSNLPLSEHYWLSRARMIAMDGEPIEPMPWSD